MVVDKLKNAAIYYSLGDRFETAFKFLQENDIESMEVGKHVIDGDKVFILIQRYDSKPIDQCKLETHKKYADIQIVFSGQENFGYANLDGLELTASNDEKDVYFYKPVCDLITLKDKTFALVLPNDAHMPCIAIDNKPEPIVKAVVKVLVD